MRRRLTTALAAVLLLGALTACSDDGGGDSEPTPGTDTPSAVEEAFDSQFTRDGTFQSHISVRGVKKVDFVYTLYPTKSTPRTNEWYPDGNKYFSFTFQAYDLARKLRDPFATKRKVYLDKISVSSKTVSVDGSPTEHPYKLKAKAKEITFDPEPVTTRYGMIITSPKGAFELRNQEIGPMAADTRGVILTFKAVVWVQITAGGSDYVKRTVKQKVPIAIFESEDPTVPTSIPVDAN